MNDFRLSDLLDLTIIQKMADAHYRAAGMPIGIIDAIDGSILVGAGWQDICVKFHRASPAMLQRCRESDNFIKDHLVEGEACRYKCKNGLWDIGVPIIVAGRHLATLFLGQFFYEGETPDREVFIQLANAYGFDIDEYLAALDLVPVFSREKVDYILEYDKALASFIADLAEHSLLKTKADETILESERKFHAIFDQAYQFLGVLSIEGRLLEANRTAMKFSGVEEVDVIGKPFWETVWWAHSPELQDKVRIAVQKAAKGESTRFEATHPAVDGSLHYVDFSLKPVTDEAGKVVLLIPEGRDITERKRTEKALIESERKYRELVENANSIILRWNRLGEVTFLNEFGLKFFGYSEAEILGRNMVGTIVPETESTGRDLQHLLQEINRDPRRFEHNINENICSDGTRVWIDWTNKAVLDHEGKIIEILSIGSDITERKRAEEALHESQSLLRAVIEASPDPIFIKDIQGRYLLGNPAVFRVWGKSREGVIGKKDRELYKNPAIADAVVANDRMVMESGMSHVMEEVIETQEGIKIYLSTKTPYCNSNDEIVGIIGIARDITGRKQTEEELRKHRENLEVLVQERTLEVEEKNERLKEEIAEREKAENEKRKVEAQLLQSQKIEALGSFAGGIAHDLNNILYPIVINTEALLDQEDPGTETHEMLKQTLDAAYRQRDLVKQILSFSHQDVRKLSPVKIVPLLENTLNFIRSTIPSSIEINRSINAPIDTIMGDSTQIQQVIINLCKNAADAMESQVGIIEVSLSDVHLDASPIHPDIKAGEYLELSVQDTGHGIPSETIDRIFDPFFTTKHVSKGSGLGLSVVHGILKKHGGTITVTSKEGEGSRFTVYLPLHDQGSIARASGREDQDTLKQKILLIDDEDIIITSLKRALEKIGYTVVAIRDAQEALDLFRKEPEAFDLVITDVTMPKMTGMELGKRIMEVRSGIPVILCTGFSDLIDEEGIKDMGFTELLMKPAGTSELKSAVRRALGS